MNGLAFAICLIAADPAPTPWDLETSIKASPTIQAMQKETAALKKELAATQGILYQHVRQPAGAAPVKDAAALQGSNPAYVLTPSVKTNDAPTYHYPAGTTYRIENGAVVLSAPANAVSYSGGPYMQSVGEGGNCANGSCGRPRGRRGR